MQSTIYNIAATRPCYQNISQRLHSTHTHTHTRARTHTKLFSFQPLSYVDASEERGARAAAVSGAVPRASLSARISLWLLWDRDPLFAGCNRCAPPRGGLAGVMLAVVGVLPSRSMLDDEPWYSLDSNDEVCLVVVVVVVVVLLWWLVVVLPGNLPSGSSSSSSTTLCIGAA